MKKKHKPPAPVAKWAGVDLKCLEDMRKNRIAQIIEKFIPKDKAAVIKTCPFPKVSFHNDMYSMYSGYEPCPQVFEKKKPEVKEPPFSSAQAFGAALLRRGFVRLGSGAYSTVYAKEGSDKVIKVTRCLDDWIDYVQWAAKEGYAGTFAPKVYSWKKYAIAKPEKPRWGETLTHFSVAIVERMEYEMSSQKAILCDFMPLTAMTRYAMKGNVMCQLLCDEIAPGYVEFYTKLGKAFESDDMHGGNIMVRPNNTFCVTDPVCGNIKTSATRLRSRDFTSLAPATLGIYYGRRFAW